LSPQGRCYSNPHGGTERVTFRVALFLFPNRCLRRGNVIRIPMGAQKESS